MIVPSPYYRQIALRRAWGEEAKAQSLLDALNRINRAFGAEPYDMPEPARDFHGLVTCPADAMTPGEFMDAVSWNEPRGECPCCGSELPSDGLCEVGCLDLAPVERLEPRHGRERRAA